MNFNSKIKSSFNTILFIEIYYITREGTVFQFQNTVNIVTNEIIPVNPDIEKFNWALEENNKIKVNQLINQLSKTLLKNKKSVIGIYEEGHLIKPFPNEDYDFIPNCKYDLPKNI